MDDHAVLAKWYSSDEDLQNLSIKYPNIFFCVGTRRGRYGPLATILARREVLQRRRPVQKLQKNHKRNLLISVMTKKQIRQCLKPFFLNTGTNISDYRIDIGEQEYVEAERATIVRFTCDGYHLFAVIYDDDTCFAPEDWMQDYDSLENVPRWVDSQLSVGLPRLPA